MLERTVRKKEDSVVPWVTQYIDDKDVPYVLLPGKLKLVLFTSYYREYRIDMEKLDMKGAS